MAYLEAISLLLLLVVAALALLPFRTMRFYLALLQASTAVGAFVLGYGFGARDVSDKIAQFIPDDSAPDAMTVVQQHAESPLWGIGVGLLLILLVRLTFAQDVRTFRDNQNAPSKKQLNAAAEFKPRKPAN